MKYEEAYIYSKDIDWFCIIGDVFCHVASAGGMIPDVINDREKLRGLQKRVFDSDFNQRYMQNSHRCFAKFTIDILNR